MAWWKILATGAMAGAAATAAMTLFQSAAGPALGQDDGDREPANVQAADDAKQAVTGEAVTRPNREAAGGLVHYATGIALGIGYVVAATRAPVVTRGLGIPFGLGVGLALDDLVVPAFGWEPWPQETPAMTHVYGLSSHAVFGAALEGGRRAALAALG